MSLCENQGKFERFQYFNFEIDFLENENPFQKKLEYHFLVESASFPYKTDMSEANVKTSKMMSAK